MRQLLKKEEGFTLIEMSLVLFIISALLLLFIPNLSGKQKDASTTGSAAFQTVLQSQVDMYKMDNKTEIVTFAAMAGEDYLTDSQLEDAKGFTINEKGIVVKKVAE